MSFIISVGKWGGVYFSSGYAIRLCLGWVAFTYIPEDFDLMMQSLVEKNKDMEELAPVVLNFLESEVRRHLTVNGEERYTDALIELQRTVQDIKKKVQENE